MFACESRAMFRLPVIAIIACLGASLPSASADIETGAAPATDIDAAVAIEAGKARFAQACSYCHGKEGVGGKTKAFKGRTDLKAEYVFETIANGRKRGANIMPPWKNALSETEIRELVAYIISLGKEALPN